MLLCLSSNTAFYERGSLVEISLNEPASSALGK